jgi:hypothetical protein
LLSGASQLLSYHSILNRTMIDPLPSANPARNDHCSAQRRWNYVRYVLAWYILAIFRFVFQNIAYCDRFCFLTD